MVAAAFSAAKRTSSATRSVIAKVVPSLISMLAVTKVPSIEGKKLNRT